MNTATTPKLRRQAPTLRATLSETARENAKQPSTPLSSSWSLVVKHGGALIEAVTVRTYYNAKGSGLQPVRACVWVRPAPGAGIDYRSGSGSASGCGYHKESAAIASALRSAGVALLGRPRGHRAEPMREQDRARPFDFGGTGSSYYPEIFEAVARAVGYRVAPGSALLVHN